MNLILTSKSIVVTLYYSQLILKTFIRLVFTDKLLRPRPSLLSVTFLQTQSINKNQKAL